MPEERHPNEAHKALFLELVMMLSTSVMQQLGKIINPMTGKTEVSLEAAQTTIDLLEMLQAKTNGNLDKEEDRMLRNTLAMLQMNYVETARSAPATPEKKPEPEQPPSGETAGAAPVADEGKKPDGKEPRFHKTYS